MWPERLGVFSTPQYSQPNRELLFIKIAASRRGLGPLTIYEGTDLGKLIYDPLVLGPHRRRRLYLENAVGIIEREDAIQ